MPTMTYGCQTWSLNKQLTNKLRTTQRAMERKMLDLKLQDKIACSEIRTRTKLIDIIEYTLKQKGGWAGHIPRMKDNRWTKEGEEIKRTTKHKMARRHNKEGGNHLNQESNRQKTVEDIAGGLHPAVDGQSLGERRKGYDARRG